MSWREGMGREQFRTEDSGLRGEELHVAFAFS